MRWIADCCRDRGLTSRIVWTGVGLRHAVGEWAKTAGKARDDDVARLNGALRIRINAVRTG